VRLAYQIRVLVHNLAMAIWAGGILFLILVMLPLARRDMDRPEDYARLLGQVARKCRRVAWIGIGLLVVPGLYIAGDHWQLTYGESFTRTDWFTRII